MASQVASDIDAELAERIKQLLIEKDLPRKQIAADLKVTTQTINSWVSRGSIKREHCKALAKYCEVTLDYLLTGAADLYQRGDNPFVLEWSRRVDVGGSPLKLTNRHCAVVDIVDLPEHLPEETTKLPQGQLMGAGVLNELLTHWTENPHVLSSLPVPIFDEESLGLPRFAIQITAREHEPSLPLGCLVAFATDILPERGDFVIMARRPKNGFWTVGAGYFSLNTRVIPANLAEFYPRISSSDMGYKVFLNRLPGEPSIDPFTVDCFADEWLTVGVGVYLMSWLHPVSRMNQTLLETRLDRRFKMRSRSAN